MNWNEKLGNQVNQPFSFFVFKERSMQYISVEQPYFCWWFWHLPNICQGLFDLNGIARRAEKKFRPILGFAQRATNGKQKNAKGIFKIFGEKKNPWYFYTLWCSVNGISTPSSIQQMVHFIPLGADLHKTLQSCDISQGPSWISRVLLNKSKWKPLIIAFSRNSNFGNRISIVEVSTFAKIWTTKDSLI